ncbi:signal transduction histidine kinase [Aquimarina sp. EL_43]|uniref:sensor histidine kinase n=1 Tax=unclassified Aquimarina TaxID=2627091 RepID=UPI0018CBD813|nr:MULTISPECIES: histidine kinase [unclassified Aquimarina]MBG6133463.1 signal transduction histidine kinase [Aquimarina sp. EL_35]MBG6153621.1 signal transduction histidine kinase [Aquimarina sp. EL_32]MBG6171777.1 signal transduction histidine kinase [Aquimarina sp. EL_43]
MGEPEEAVALKVIIIGMVVIFLLSLSVIIFFILYQRRLLAQQEKHQKIESDYQKELLKTSIISQEEERSRIAKELHDDVGAMLTTTKLYFGQITPELPPEELKGIAEKMSSFFDDMIQSVRSISQDLRPVVLEKLGLVEATQSLVQTINDSGKIKVHFKNNTIKTIAKSKELNLYRIIQELITNTLKHAEASAIYVELKNEGNSLIILYEDDGKGLKQKNLLHKKGLGLKNIESRLSVLSGKIHFFKKSSGMKVKIVIRV